MLSYVGLFQEMPRYVRALPNPSLMHGLQSLSLSSGYHLAKAYLFIWVAISLTVLNISKEIVDGVEITSKVKFSPSPPCMSDTDCIANSSHLSARSLLDPPKPRHCCMVDVVFFFLYTPCWWFYLFFFLQAYSIVMMCYVTSWVSFTFLSLSSWQKLVMCI